MSSSVWAIVVTYNRKTLLLEALGALRAQTIRPAHVLIIDNASSDGTQDALATAGILDDPWVTSLRLAENMGGAGGFAKGMEIAFSRGAHWVWAMDDDAMPVPTALEALLATQPAPLDVHASTAGDGERLAWPLRIREGDGHWRMARQHAEVPERAIVETVPFLGLLVHRDLVERIGLPVAGFFIAADDTEFCVRARHHGATIRVAGASQIRHPLAEVGALKLGPVSIAWLNLPPWKRYYDTRNRLLIARRHYGMRAWTQTLPATLLRLAVATLRGPDRRGQFRATAAGIIDALRGREGRRHEHWNIRP